MRPLRPLFASAMDVCSLSHGKMCLCRSRVWGDSGAKRRGSAQPDCNGLWTGHRNGADMLIHRFLFEAVRKFCLPPTRFRLIRIAADRARGAVSAVFNNMAEELEALDEVEFDGDPDLLIASRDFERIADARLNVSAQNFDQSVTPLLRMRSKYPIAHQVHHHFLRFRQAI